MEHPSNPNMVAVASEDPEDGYKWIHEDELEDHVLYGEGPDATGAAETLAEEHGVDLSDIEGSGQDGRITKPDVEDYLE